MRNRLLLVLVAAIAVFALTSSAVAQTCQDVHGVGSTGCAPSPMVGASVTLTGIVYVPAGTYNSGSVYFQCPGGTGGMTFFESGATYLEGDEISVTGTIGAFGDEIQFDSGAAVTVLSSGNSAVAMPIGSGALLAGTDMLADFMSVEGLLAEVSIGFNSIFTIDDGSGAVTVFVDGTTGINVPAMQAMVGDIVRVRGATKCFGGAGEVLPRNDNDITLITVATEASSWGAVKAQFED